MLRMSAILLLVAAAAVSCGDADGVAVDTQSADTTAAAAESETEELTGFGRLETVDYGGYEFRVLHENQDERQVDIMTVGAENGDAMNDIVYRRNTAVEDKYNITITAEQDSGEAVNVMIKKSVAAGVNDYDLYFNHCSIRSVAADGYLYDLNELPHVDLTQIWWDQASISGLSVGDRVFYATGDISPMSLMTSSCLVFNKKLLAANDIDYPYQAVYDGKWTLDRFIEITKGLSVDMNGNGKYDYGVDMFGYSSWSADSPFALFYGAGGMFSEKNAEGIPEIKYDVDRISSIMDKAYRLVVEQNAYLEKSEHERGYMGFANGYSYFNDATFQKINTFLRDMEDDYGILPYPKYDEDQDAYYACVNGAGDFIGVPSNAEDPVRSGMIVEALASAAYDYITPSLYDVIVKGKNTRDEDSMHMVDLIIRNRVFDPVYIHGFSLGMLPKRLLESGRNDVASQLEKGRSAAEKSLAKEVEAYLSIE